MRWIRKGVEPSALTLHKAASNSSFDNIPTDAKAAVTEALVSEQGALCAYCMRRIRPDSMKVEHRDPQGSPTGSSRTLEWSNLLGVCSGHEGEPRRRQTCDTRKGHASIDVDPTMQGHVALLTYPGGRVESRNVAHQHDIDQTLNLNKPALVNGRDAAKRGVLESWAANKGRWTRAFMTRKLAQLRSGKALPEYLGIVEWTLEQRMR